MLFSYLYIEPTRRLVFDYFVSQPTASWNTSTSSFGPYTNSHLHLKLKRISKGFDDRSSTPVSLFKHGSFPSYKIKHRLRENHYGRQGRIIRRETGNRQPYSRHPTDVTLLGRTPLTRGNADSIGMSGAFRITSIVCMYPRWPLMYDWR